MEFRYLQRMDVLGRTERPRQSPIQWHTVLTLGRIGGLRRPATCEVVSYGQDTAGRLTTVSTGGVDLVSNLAWNPAGLKCAKETMLRYPAGIEARKVLEVTGLSVRVRR